MAVALRPAPTYAPPASPSVADAVPLDPVIVYTRKSSEDGNAQARSHDQQLDVIHQQYPADTIVRYFADDKSGKTFEDRPGFRAMLHWCQQHRQPRTRPGRIVMYDKSRFGRALIPGTDETDWIAYDEARLAFAKVGWELEFMRSQRTGNKVVDRIVDTLDDEQSSEYIRRLRANVIRGQEDAIKQGYWCRGVAPFPSQRVEARSGKVLAEALRDDTGAVVREGKQAVQPAERAQHGARVILAPHPERVPHWNEGARLLLAGASWRTLVRYFQDHVRTQRGGKTRWTRKGLRNVYTNEALIGILDRVVDGKRQRIKAQWAPIVDVELFQQVQHEIARRDATYAVSGRRTESEYILTNVRCQQCGARYTGAVRTSGGKRPTSRRYYVHPDLADLKLPKEQQAAAEAAGCRHYSLPADFLEARVVEAIGTQRGSEQFAEALDAIHRELRSALSDHEVLVAQCQDRLADAQEELENLLSALAKSKGAAQDLVLARVNQQQEVVDAATHDLEAAEHRLEAAADVREASVRHIDETREIVATWPTAPVDARYQIMQRWVAQITVEPQPRATARGGQVVDKLCRIWFHPLDAEALEVLIPGVVRTFGEEEFKSKNCPTPNRSTTPGCLFFSSAHWRNASVGMVAGSYRGLPSGLRKLLTPECVVVLVPAVLR